jgi:hypothetical protein
MAWFPRLHCWGLHYAISAARPSTGQSIAAMHAATINPFS